MAAVRPPANVDKDNVTMADAKVARARDNAPVANVATEPADWDLAAAAESAPAAVRHLSLGSRVEPITVTT